MRQNTNKNRPSENKNPKETLELEVFLGEK